MLPQRKPQIISIVGGGRVGRALGRRLHELGWHIGAVTGRSTSTARSAVREIGAGLPLNRLSHAVLDAAVVLIAVPDSAVEDVAKELAVLGGREWHRNVVLHTSGSLGPGVLRPLAALGAATGSMHPMQTFSHQSYPDLGKVIFAIDGAPAAIRTARKIVQQFGAVAVRLSGANKAAYHAAGSFACAHVLAAVEAGTRLLMAQGFTRRQAQRAILPLTRQTLDNLERLGPRAAWTGPVPRGDLSTVAKHIQALGEFPPEFLAAYEALSCLAVVMLDAKPGATLQQLKRAFDAGAGRKTKN